MNQQEQQRLLTGEEMIEQYAIEAIHLSESTDPSMQKQGMAMLYRYGQTFRACVADIVHAEVARKDESIEQEIALSFFLLSPEGMAKVEATKDAIREEIQDRMCHFERAQHVSFN